MKEHAMSLSSQNSTNVRTSKSLLAYGYRALDAVSQEHPHATAGNSDACGGNDAIRSRRDSGSDQPAALARASAGIRRGVADHGHDRGVNGVDDPEERSFVGAERDVAGNRVGESGARSREHEDREREDHRARRQAGWDQPRT